jgi:hypothetical protein
MTGTFPIRISNAETINKSRALMFRDIKQCRPLKVDRRFEGICCILIWIENSANQRACKLLVTYFMLVSKTLNMLRNGY